MASGGGGTTTPPAQVSNMTTTTSIDLLHNQTQPLHSLFLSTPATFFGGSRSMVSFEDVKQGCNSNKRSLFNAYDLDYEDDGMDEYFHQPEKKQRLSIDQVQFLEKSFEVENKLEPDRKTKLAKELGLQPRQVAIWFQNRRARWKTKQMEKDYDSLNHSYQSLKTDCDNLLKEKDRLQAEVASLTEKVLAREKQEGKFESKTKGLTVLQEPLQKPMVESISEGDQGSKISAGGCNKQVEDISSARSDILDSDGVHSAQLETCDSSYVVFEADQSDLSSLDEEDSLLLHHPYMFTKLEDHHVNYSDPSERSCNFGFPEEVHSLWPWSY